MSTSEPRRRGGQPGNRNALKHGRTTREAKALRRIVRTRIRCARWAIGHARYVCRVTAILARIGQAKSRQSLNAGAAYPRRSASNRFSLQRQGNGSTALRFERGPPAKRTLIFEAGVFLKQGVAVRSPVHRAYGIA